MFRRRRPLKNEEIHFSFDSFLDLVTNVVGIIIRLILVTWVGARSYHASMEMLNLEPLPRDTPTVKITDDPLHARIEQSKTDLDDAKTRLLAQLRELEATGRNANKAQAELTHLTSERETLERDSGKLSADQNARGVKVQQVSLSVEDVRKRSRKLLDDIKALEAGASNKKQLKYHAPLSKTVQSEELFFECKAGRVTYIDLPAMLQEVKGSLEKTGEELKTSWRVEKQTAPVGPYRLRYTIEREKTVLDAGAAPVPGNFRYGLSEWLIEPLTAEHGETQTQALKPGSEFRQIVDQLDPQLTTVTFWIYPDSFELFRQLRDHLYERGHDVAGRPLPPGAPIAASKHGTASRGQ